MDHMCPPTLYGLDIETDTNVSDAERAKGILKKGLDPAYAAITDVAVAGDAWEKVLTGSEREILLGLNHLLAGLVPGILVTWNGAAFDLPYLQARYEFHGLDNTLFLRYDPELEVKYEPLPGHPGAYRAEWGLHRHVDISHLYKSRAAQLGVKHSLKPVYQAVTGDRPIEVDRENMHLLTDAERQAYGASDSRITRILGHRLPLEELYSGVDFLGACV